MEGSIVQQSRRERRALERQRRKRGGTARKGAAASGAALALGALAAGTPAGAAIFNVTNLDDAGAGSLRQALADANAAAGADVITFQAGLTGSIILTTGQLYIADSVDIQGPGAAVVAVNGNGGTRVLYLYSGSALLDVSISGLTITNGSAGDGAGILDAGENLTLDGVVLSGNAVTGDGGGLWATTTKPSPMSLTIRDSVISGNTADNDGGGLFLYGNGESLLIQNTSITGNFVGGSGAGIYLYDPGATTIESSTISGNTASGPGGGIYFYNSGSGTHVIRGTTISGNTASKGGGIYLYFLGTDMTIENSTISGNQAVAGAGGGIYLYSLYEGGSLTLRHVTIAGNTASGSGGGIFAGLGPPNINNSIVGDNTAASDNDLGNGSEGGFDLSFSLVESPGTANINDNGGNVFNQDAQLGPLANNGGPTETHLPAGTSPAVNAGNNGSSLATDQRGTARPVGLVVDMGAVEVNPGTIQLATNAASVNENAGTVTITVTRTGGTDGAVSVAYGTNNGSAAAPGDFATTAGVLNWASGDGAAKSFQVTIVNDVLDEPDETFTANLSSVSGGAVLGATTTEVVTILDDDVLQQVIEVPTLGDYGRLLLAGFLAAAGFLLMRRRRGMTAPVVILTLALGGAAAASAATSPRPTPRPARKIHREIEVGRMEVQGEVAILRLEDGTTLKVPLADLEIRERPHPRKRAAAAPAQTGDKGKPVVVKIRRGAHGDRKKVRVVVFDTPEAAQAAAQRKSG